MQPASYLFNFDDLLDTPSRAKIFNLYTNQSRFVMIEINELHTSRVLSRQIASLYADLYQIR